MLLAHCCACVCFPLEHKTTGRKRCCTGCCPPVKQPAGGGSEDMQMIRSDAVVPLELLQDFSLESSELIRTERVGGEALPDSDVLASLQHEAWLARVLIYIFIQIFFFFNIAQNILRRISLWFIMH